VRLVPRGGPPLGVLFGGIGLAAGGLVAVLHLDRLPVVMCVFKGLTGLPCPSCGSTRALGRLFALDLAGALSMNPLTTVGAFALAAWAVVDLLLLAGRRALAIEIRPRLAFMLRVVAVVLVLANWIFLLAAGR
jgi:hypothetical protein